MDNRQATITNVRPFYEEAARRGCYTSKQKDVYDSTWKNVLLGSILPEHNLDPDTLTVEALQSRLDELFRSYGNAKNVKPATISTYTAKISRLLKDFINYHGKNDWMAWKEKNAKTLSSPRQRRATTRKVRSKTHDPQPSNLGEPCDKYPLKVPGDGPDGELRIPSNIDSDGLKMIWRQLDAVKLYVAAQHGVELTEGELGGSI